MIHPRNINNEIYLQEIPQGNRRLLAQAITLIESTRKDDYQKGRSLLKELYPLTGNSYRIGITGVPGVGKSTLIEHFGLFLIQQGYKVAVLAVDPSSAKTKGSILGDKTRMQQLAAHPNS
ncbi:MAG: methylmalonyl Co-A mutase-associated GTPase MeaB, partial [Bacteroidia bacterium]|nr:methylmalonyl Co-A mutase-associated GTPase MeaB [Bacteroidia bacterium]